MISIKRKFLYNARFLGSENSNDFRKVRISRHKKYINFSNSILFYSMVIFVLVIGSILALRGTIAYKYEGLIVKLPDVECISGFIFDNNTSIRIWMNRNHEILLNNYFVNFETLPIKILDIRKTHSNNIIRLKIDRACQMEYVDKLIAILRDNGYNHFILSAYPNLI